MGSRVGLVNLHDFERAARRRLPVPVFDSVTGGGSDELTLRANQARYRDIHLRPRVARDVSRRDLSTTVLGERISMPVMLAPCGFQRMLHREAELAVARAAGDAGTGFALSTVAAYALEDVAAVASGPRWYQYYMPHEREAAATLMDRAAAAGYTALVVTLDTPMHGLREREARNRVVFPLRPYPHLVAAVAARPRWALDFVRGGVGRGYGASARLPMSVKEAGKVISRVAHVVTYDDIDWIRERWKGKLLAKGVQRGDDATRLVDHGVDGIVVSNHGGRQLDTVLATIDALPGVVAAVGDRAEVFIDGGIRRGTDVVKALALGARATFIGRPYLYGLAVAGQAGVARVLEILRHEIDSALGLLGCASVDEVERDLVLVPGEPGHPLTGTLTPRA